LAAIRETQVENERSPRNELRCVRTMTRISCAASSAGKLVDFVGDRVEDVTERVLVSRRRLRARGR
jgi:hypothetical protein